MSCRKISIMLILCTVVQIQVSSSQPLPNPGSNELPLLNLEGPINPRKDPLSTAPTSENPTPTTTSIYYDLEDESTTPKATTRKTRTRTKGTTTTTAAPFNPFHALAKLPDLIGKQIVSLLTNLQKLPIGEAATASRTGASTEAAEKVADTVTETQITVKPGQSTKPVRKTTTKGTTKTKTTTGTTTEADKEDEEEDINEEGENNYPQFPQ